MGQLLPVAQLWPF